MAIDTVEIINKTCIEKVAMSEECANKIIDRCGLEGNIMYFYKCKFCKAYHISKQDSTKDVVEII